MACKYIAKLAEIFVKVQDLTERMLVSKNHVEISIAHLIFAGALYEEFYSLKRRNSGVHLTANFKLKVLKPIYLVLILNELQ